MSEHWEEPPEEDGLTLGPEEALQREIKKSKTLKVDRLRLRDEIEKLKAETADLIQKNHLLKERLTALGNPSAEPEKASEFFRNILIFALVSGSPRGVFERDRVSCERGSPSLDICAAESEDKSWRPESKLH